MRVELFFTLIFYFIRQAFYFYQKYLIFEFEYFYLLIYFLLPDFSKVKLI